MPDKTPEPRVSLPPSTGSYKNEWYEGSPETFRDSQDTGDVFISASS